MTVDLLQLYDYSRSMARSMRHMYLSQIRGFIKAVESLWVVEIFGAEGFLGAMDGTSGFSCSMSIGTC